MVIDYADYFGFPGQIEILIFDGIDLVEDVLVFLAEEKSKVRKFCEPFFEV